MCELRNLTRKEKKFLINNNCDPKDYLFFEELEDMIVFIMYILKTYGHLKRTYLNKLLNRVSPNLKIQL